MLIITVNLQPINDLLKMGFFDFLGSTDSDLADFWNNLDDSISLDEIDNLSRTTPVLLFKHSTRCSVSSMVKRSLEREWSFQDHQILPFYLDLLKFRSISNEIAEKYRIQHASPQVLLIKNGKCIYNASHSSISVKAIEENL